MGTEIRRQGVRNSLPPKDLTKNRFIAASNKVLLSSQNDATDGNQRAIETIHELRQMLDDHRQQYDLHGDGNAHHSRWQVIHTSLSALDDALPRGGFVSGTVAECLYRESGAGAMELALRVSQAAAVFDDHDSQSISTRHRPIVIIDTNFDFYPPAAVRMGVDPNCLLIVRPPDPASAYWAMDQCLRCPAIASVVGLLNDLDELQSRRLQLAAEHGGGLGLIVSHRPQNASINTRKSFAAVRMLIEPLGSTGCSRLLNVTLLRVHEGIPAGPFEVELPDEALFMPASAASVDRTLTKEQRRAAG